MALNVVELQRHFELLSILRSTLTAAERALPQVVALEAAIINQIKSVATG